MSIPEWAKRSKDGLIIAILVLSSTASFGLGVLAGREQGSAGGNDGFRLENVPQQSAAVGAALEAEPARGTDASQVVAPAKEVAALPQPATPGSYVAAKTGTKYYLPWCGTVSRIKEENRVWFSSKAEAEAAGYEPAANCKGL